ncbi:nose resistant to fluoxetine protein 6-like [Leptopilina boulardi]|uniref:nose resistant to fluoxetine protein 6-like n=1 Tax=Leptopilina boulardi TaxID=63433 RepID=UPI0021F56399|nr:nose resistant to fluoxetine protein 6-like [Leptopilina boulardi]
MNLSFCVICIFVKFAFNFLNFPVVIGENTLSKIEILTKECNKNNYTIRDESNFENIYNKESKNVEKSPWFLNIPLLPIIVATSNSIPEGSCKKQLLLYLNNLKNGTLWATQMFDSSAKYPYGVFNGFTRHLGSFDQCDEIQTKILNNEDGKIEEIHSKYCLVDVKFKEKNERTQSLEELKIFFDPQGSAWEAIREKGDFRRYKRYILQMALCFPAKCQTEDIVAALKQPLDKFGAEYNLQVEASIIPMYCASKEAQKFSIYDIIFYLISLIILSLIIISTLIDINCDKNKEHSLLRCFSARKNVNEIFKINYEHRGLDTIHFIRVLFTVLTVSCHRQLQYMYGGNISGKYYEWIMTDPIFGIIHNIPIAIEGFFGMGGLLMSHSLLEELSISKNINIILLVVKRLVRILPTYMFITFAYATVFHRLGSGPFWESTMGFYRDSCLSYWWTNLFLINNYFGGNNKCVIQSWYLAVDFHCYLIGLMLIIVFNKMSRKVGYIFLGCTLILSIGIPFYFTYKDDLVPILKSFINPRRLEDSDDFLNYYVKTHIRMEAYITGLIVGVLIFDYKESNWRLSKTWSNILFITFVFMLSLTVTWPGTLLTNPNLKISAFQKALYASLHRPIYAFSICSIPLLLTIGDGLGFYYNILTARWLQPLSRISYGIFMVHFIVLHFEFGTTRTAFTSTWYNFFKYLAADMVYSVCLSLFTAIVIEFPIRNIFNLFMKRKRIVTKRKPSLNIEEKTK